MAVLAYRTYLRAPEQEEAEPENASDNEAEDSLREILVFRTSKQKTWLAVTDQGSSCRIDDTRPGKGGPQWVFFDSEAYHVNPGQELAHSQ